MSKPLAFVLWKWKPNPGYRSKFESEHVNTMARMLARHYHAPHEVVCITDDADGIDPAIRVIPLWPELGEIPSPHGQSNPSCYRRLRAFSREASDFIAPRFVSIDLDAVIVDDVTSLFDDTHDFKIWGDTARNTPYNGGLWMLRAGARAQVWETFDPIKSPAAGKRLGYVGSDQAWIGACLGRGEAKWSRRDGVYSYRNDVTIGGRGSTKLPPGARIVMFHGRIDPWHPEAQALPWVRDNYR